MLKSTFLTTQITQQIGMKNAKKTKLAFESQKWHLCGQREAACRSASAVGEWAAAGSGVGPCSPGTAGDSLLTH